MDDDWLVQWGNISGIDVRIGPRTTGSILSKGQRCSKTPSAVVERGDTETDVWDCWLSALGAPSRDITDTCMHWTIPSGEKHDADGIKRSSSAGELFAVALRHTKHATVHL